MMLFRNRAHAAELLLGQLGQYAGQRPLVLAIPRGAVPMGKIIADGLGGDLDVVLVRKLQAPDQPELAIGAIDEDGRVYLAAHAQAPWISKEYGAALLPLRVAPARSARAVFCRCEYVDLVEAGIIDPTKVVRLALENAVSVASVLLLTEATLTEVSETETTERTPPFDES